MAKQKKISKQVVAAIIIILVFAALAALHLAGAFNTLEFKAYDLQVRFWAERSMISRPSDEIIVILVDQHSIEWAQRERGWGWPWPREAYAEIVDYLGLAKSVAFDIIFSEPSIYDLARNEQRDDASFIQAGRDFGKVVQTVFFSTQTGNALSWPQYVNKPFFMPENFGPLLDKYRLDEGYGAQLPIRGLVEAAGTLGCVTGVPDSDGIFRRLRLFTMFDGRAVPGLSAASFLVSGNGGKISYSPQERAIQWGDYFVPVDKEGQTLLRYRGNFERYAPYNAMQILQSAEAVKRGEEPLLSRENFRDTYVFCGLYASGLFDTFPSPLSPFYPGMMCHITMLDNMLAGDFIRESALWLDMIVMLAVIALVVFLSMFSKRIPLSVLWLALIAAVIVVLSFAAYNWFNLWIPMVTFLAAIVVAFVSVTLYNYATEGSQKRFIKSAFSQYLSPKVIEQIIADPSQLKLGGEKREMSAIFTDIRSFSTISEALGDPAKLVELLNYYLTRMSNIVLNHQGTIDKYEGDAIIAFFGAPVRLNNHASLACRAAINMKKEEMDINRGALEQGLITPGVMKAMAAKGIIKSVNDPYPIFTRLGINTGEMVVGNMGTPNKMDYTIMGNAVNLAARLEGVNKQYNTKGILISEYTRERIGDEFILRPLSRVRVVGINTPIRLYELLDIADAASGDLKNMVKSWEQGFAAYESRDFLAAKGIFDAVCQKDGEDLAAKKYLDRCIKYIASPPADAEWDNGVDNLTEK